MDWIWVSVFVLLVGGSAYSAARHVLRQPEGLPRVLATCVIGWAWVTVGAQALGALGFLNRPALLGLAIAGFIAASGLRFILPRERLEEARPLETPWDAWAILSLGALAMSCLLIGVPSLLLPPKIVSDGPIYHLFFAAKWWKAGRIFLVASPFGENAATYFPANGDLWFSVLMTLFDGDRLARVGQAPFLWVTGIATYAIAKRLGASGSASLIATCWAVSCFPLLLFSFEANVDTIFLAGYLSMVFFLLRYALDGGSWTNLLLAGLAAGLAWGTKPTATAFVPPLLAIASLLILCRRLSWRETFSQFVLISSATLLTCGFWFGRSLILTGNPLYPLHLEAFGRVWLRGWYRSADMAKSQFYLPVDDWRSLISTVMMVFDPRLVPVWVAALLGAGLWGRRADRETRWVWGIALLSVANVAIYWLAIPYRTQQRFMLQALCLGAAPLAVLFDRARIAKALGFALLIVHLSTSQSWPFAEPGKRAFWELSAKIPAGAPSPIQTMLAPSHWKDMLSRSSGLEYVIVAVSGVIFSFVIAWIWSRAVARRSLRWWATACSASLALVIVYALRLDALNGTPSRRVFPIFNEYQRAWAAIESFSPPQGAKIAYAGTNLPLMLMASGQRNDVSYVNIDAHPNWQLHDYHLSAAERGDPEVWPSPRPGWDRIHPDYSAWLNNLQAKQIGFLVVAKVNPADGSFNLADAEQFPIERVWADAHPEIFTRLYPREGPDPEMRLYRVHFPKT